MGFFRKLFRLEDQDYNPHLPHGLCEAKFACGGPIPYYICGALTNLKYGKYWACSRHQNPSG